MPSSRGLGVAHHDDRGRAVVQRARVAGGDPTVRAERGLERRQLLELGVGAGTVVGRDDRAAVGERIRRDLALEEPSRDRGAGALLRLERERVHLLAGHALDLGDVLGGLAHRDVDVGKTRGGRPVALVAVRPRERPQRGVGELRVRRVRGVVGAPAAQEPAHRLDPGGDERVALAGPDRVGGHAQRLQRARAVARDRAAGDLGHVGEDRHDAAHVEALLTAGETAAEHEVVDGGAVELGNLLQRGVDDERRHVVGPLVDERALHGPADRASGRWRRSRLRASGSS